MRGELDDVLARMARMEELRRRRAEEPSPDRRSAVDELVDAVRRVVVQHPELVVRLRVDDGVTPATVRVAWSEGAVIVTRDDEQIGMPSAGAPPSWPMSVKTVPAWSGLTDPPSADSAARLADLIRRDPSLLRTADDED